MLKTSKTQGVYKLHLSLLPVLRSSLPMNWQNYIKHKIVLIGIFVFFGNKKRRHVSCLLDLYLVVNVWCVWLSESSIDAYLCA